MDRRHLLALAPVAALTACASQQGDSPSPASDGGAGPAPSDGSGASDAGGAAPTQEPTPTAPAVPEAVTALLEDMSPQEIAGQLVMVGVMSGARIDAAAVEEHHVGGFFLLSIWRDAEAVRRTVERAVELSRPDLPPLMAVDQEGGQVRMLRGDAAPQVASAHELGSDGPEAVREGYREIGRALAELGLACALAPVADVVDADLGRGNGPVGALDRGFGTDPEQVAECVRAAVDGLEAEGVAATLKHFPGLGGVEQNTDHAAEGITDEAMEREDPTLAAFSAGIEEGAQLVMLSSAIYPRIDPEHPAMHSRTVVTDMLREDLGFEGLAVTDDIGAAKAIAHVPVPERATRFLAAGGDVVLTADPALAGELVDAIRDWAEESEEQAEHVRAAAQRMLELKHALGLLEG